MKRLSILVLITIALFLIGIGTGIRTEKLVIDTDAGADDAIAILLVTSSWAKNDSNFELIAITCVYGNTEVKNVEQNVLKTITIANITSVPIYRGAYKPLINDYTADNYFGDDGFGDFNFTITITAKVNTSTHAALALIELAKKHKGQLNILALGPLTNIALAIKLDPDFVNNVKRFYIMGGSVKGGGNIRPGVEFNFGTDPESNFIVLNSTRGQPSLLLPWETILKTQISKEWRYNTLASIDSDIINFFNNAEKKSLSTNASTWCPADAMAAAIMMWPYLSKRNLIRNVSPVVDGAAKGSLLVDYAELSGKSKNVEIVQELAVSEFLNKIFQTFLPLKVH